MNLGEVLGSMMPTKRKSVKLLRKRLCASLSRKRAKKLIDMEEVSAEAIDKSGTNGIVFLDEIDKIAVSDSKSGIDVSRGGVQRDILPLVEGATVNTKHGPVKPIIFFLSPPGACFRVAKPSDLMPELQGRFLFAWNWKA